MMDRPLTSNNKLSLVMFGILSIPILASGVAVIPTLLILYGIYMMKKDNDFSNISSVVKFTEILLSIAFSICAIGWFNLSIGGGYPEQFPLYTIIVGVYFLLFRYLFYVPLKAHSKWVETNHIFYNKPVASIADEVTSQVHVKAHDIKQPHAADELMKWVKLKDDGHISEEEFNEAKAKLLKSN